MKFISSFRQTYFEDNPRDLQLLRHDKSLHTVKGQQHLKHIPDYLGINSEPYRLSTFVVVCVKE